MHNANKLYFAVNGVFDSLFFEKDILDNNGIERFVFGTLTDIFKKTRTIELQTINKITDAVSRIKPDNISSVNKTINRIQDYIKDHGKKIVPLTGNIVYEHSEKTYRTVKKKLSSNAGIPFTFSYPDEVAIERINTMQNLFIGNHYKDKVTKQAESIIRKTIRESQGNLSRQDISSALKEQLKGIPGQKGYFDIVANQVLCNARSYSNMRFFNEANILEYEISAVMDKVTSLQCQMMNGKTLSVAVTLKRYSLYDEAKTIDEVKSINPWIDARSNNGETIFMIGGRVIDPNMSGEDLQGLGLNAPPYHSRCRTIVLALF